jgi:N-acetylglutamate synthase-like GNAT family acetyltransferase
MREEEAQQVADLLNSQNKLQIQYDANRVLESAKNYITLMSGQKVLACVELKRVQWYQYEIDHLSVLPSERGKGLAQQLLTKCEQKAKSMGGHVLQCTIREGNVASTSLFKKNGFSKSSQFYNHRTNNSVNVWQKAIARK